MLITEGFELSQNLTSKTNNFDRWVLNIQDCMSFPYWLMILSLYDILIVESNIIFWQNLRSKFSHTNMLTNQIKMNVRVLNDMMRFPLRYSKNLFMFASVGKDRQTVFFCEIMNYLFAKLLAKWRQYVLAGKSLQMNQF